MIIEGSRIFLLNISLVEVVGGGIVSGAIILNSLGDKRQTEKGVTGRDQCRGKIIFSILDIYQ